MVMNVVIVAVLYLVVAVVLFVTQRALWVRWYASEYPSLYRDGEVGGVSFALICLFWPGAFTMFLIESWRRRHGGGEGLLDRFVKRGAR